jgi:class 3 adenylate cyclase
MKRFLRFFIEEFFLYSGQFTLFFVIMLFAMPRASEALNAESAWILALGMSMQIFLLVAFGRIPLLRFLFSFITPAVYSMLQYYAGEFDFFNMASFFLWGVAIYVGLFQALSLAVRSTAAKRFFETWLALGTTITFVFFYFYLDLQVTYSQRYFVGLVDLAEYNRALTLSNFVPAFTAFISSPQHSFIAFGGAFFGIILLTNKVQFLGLVKRIRIMFDNTSAQSLPPDAKERAAKGERREVTILYADIWNFTGLVEKLDPAHQVEVLDTWYACWNTAAERHHAFVDQFVGDTAVIAFGMLGEKDHQERAVECALDFLGKLTVLQEELENRKLPPIRHVGVGIHTSTVTVGELGVKGARQVTLFGDAINIASRLDSLCREFRQELIVSQSTYESLPIEQQTLFEPLGEVLMRTSPQPVPVWGRR